MKKYRCGIINKDRTIIKKRSKIIITCTALIFIIITLMSIAAVATNLQKYTVKIIPSYTNEDEEESYYIKASNYSDYGKQAANRFPYNLVNLIAGEMSSEEEEEIENIIENMSQDFQDELEGFADNFGITPVRALYLIRTFVSYIPKIEGCTTTLATNVATKYYETFLTQNLDTNYTNVCKLRLFYRFPWCVTITVPGFYSYACLGWPLVYELPLVNEKKLGFGGNGIDLRENDPDVDSGPGWSTYFLETLAISTCETVSEVRNLFFDPPGCLGRASGYYNDYPHHFDNSVSVWCDKDGGILAIEQMHSYFNPVFENPDNPEKIYVLWHANHHQWNGTYPTGSKTPDEYPSSGERARIAKNLLEEYYKQIDKDVCMNIITKNHDGGDPLKKDSYDICRHHDENNSSNTAIAWIIDSKDNIVWLKPDQPCNTMTNWREYDFGELFNTFNSNVQQLKNTFSTYSNGYYFQNGVISYLFNKLENENYFLEEYNDEDYNTSLIMCSFLSDMMMISSNTQINHDYTVTLIENEDTDNQTLLNMSLMANGIVNSSLGYDDPGNNTWTTIQKAVDNMSKFDVLVIEKGNYSEDVIVNKSLIIFGVDDKEVILDGSIRMINPYDYELLNETDLNANVNMSGLGLLLHFNNDSVVGENYSNSNIVYDYSIGGNHGYNNNASWTISTIKGEGAFDFNGINSFMNLSNSIPAFTGENVTVSCWVFWQNGSGSIDPLISQSNLSDGYCLYINNTNNKPVFRLDGVEAISSTNISNGWYHIVGTHNETTLKIFVNGFLSGSATKSGSGACREAFIGFDNNSNYFNGTIDEIAVWNRTLSDEEIHNMYNLNYGVVLDGVTICNSDIGVVPVNHSTITNCILTNHTTGILVDNVSDIKIQCNFSECINSLKVNNSYPDENNKIRIMDCNVNNNVNGFFINSSSQIDVIRIILNCSDSPMSIDNCNFSTINIKDTFAVGNESPDKPSLSGPVQGDINTSYTFYSCTNDSDGDILFYFFDWGDGNDSGWIGPYDSNITINASYSWMQQGGYYVRVKTKDIFYNESDWSEAILFRTETLAPLINIVNCSPEFVGFGELVGINVNCTDDMSGNYSGIRFVFVNVTFPDSSCMNFTMDSIGGNLYCFNFSDTWLVGQYNYSICAVDNAYNWNNNNYLGCFNVSSQANMSICTIKDTYENNDFINITDSPGSNPTSQGSIGYELLDNGSVLHVWNNFDHYYFNTSNGIQLTNHYNKYWSHNVLMLGYYNNDQWNLVYRTDNLSGFNKNIDTDNETYVNATLWKNLTYQGYDFRLAIRYHLGVDDKELTIIPYIKNLGQAIPYNLGFAWEIKDIQVDMAPSGDYIEINGTTYYLNQSLDETYKNMTQSCLYIHENISSDKSESLYLCWNDSLDYLVKVKSRTGQYNAPVTLGIKIGTLAVGQEKYTSLLWHDTSEITYYFNSYNTGEAWSTNPSYMVDESPSTCASTTINGDVELCNGNNCSGDNLGTISKVELRVSAYYTGSSQRDTILRPVFNSVTDGIDYRYQTPPGSGPAWSSWFDITNDPFAPESWSWTDVKNLDCDVEAGNGMLGFTLYCSKIEIKVTYTSNNNNPEISNPYPSDGSTGISITPTLNITVADPDEDNMSITWYSNSSGSWQVFGTNNSVGNGTYHQIMSNASINGMWWYWKVNVTDGINYTESSVYKFYTGYESKINNTGSTNIKGYLLIQVQYYNDTSSSWVVADDTVNETTSRTINSSGQLALDTIFNGLVSTSDLSEYGNGIYRVYAAFRDPDGDVLVCDDDSLLEATYEFTVNI